MWSSFSSVSWIIFWSTVQECNSQGVSPCYSDSNSFKDICDGLNGVVAMSSCFFPYTLKPTKAFDFGQAWNQCGQLNATFAQIQTTTEFDSIAAFVTAMGQGESEYAVYIALKRTQGNSDSQERGMDLDVNFWCDGPSSCTSLSAGETWIRNRASGVKRNNEKQCYGIDSVNGLKLLACGQQNAPLCQLKDTRQSYKLVKGTCIQEGIVGNFDNSDVNQCAEKCHLSVSCRSFNIIDDTKCQLTSWLTDSDTTGVANCIHYDLTKSN